MIYASHTIKSAALFALGLLLFFVPQHSAASLPLKRTLILFPHDSNVSGFLDLENSLRSTLMDSKDYRFEFYTECTDLSRFSTQSYNDQLMELYRERYSGLELDLILAVQPRFLQFPAEYRPESFHFMEQP